MTDHPTSPPCDDPACGPCAQARAVAAFRGEHVEHADDACPVCGQTTPVLRVTESLSVERVEYADPGLRPDKKARYPLDTEERVRAAVAGIGRDTQNYRTADLKQVRARIKAAAKRFDIAVPENSTTEAVINGKQSWDDLRTLVRRGIQAMLVARQDPGSYEYCWAYIVDISDTDVVWMGQTDDLYLASWVLNTDGTVSVGEPVEVVRTYAPADIVGGVDDGDVLESATESVARPVTDVVGARVLEDKGTDDKGNRIFAVRIISYGESKNRRRYPESVMRAAAPLYEGAKAYDHHRTAEEMSTGTIQGLIGYYRNVEGGTVGIEADLCLLPSAVHAAEALDAALTGQSEGLDPLVGISHDVYGKFRSITENGRQFQEATEITAVNSADIVSTPAAGGQATRAVAGGINPTPEETDVAVNAADVLAALKEATVDQLAEVGLARAGTESTDKAGDKPATKTTETDGDRTTEAETFPRDGYLARMIISAKVTEAQLPTGMVESVTAALPKRISEADIDAQIAVLKGAIGHLERAGLTPTVTTTLTQEAVDKKIAALDAMFDGNLREGYRSIKHAFADFTGQRRLSYDEDENRVVLRESMGTYDSATRARSTESMTSASWDQVLGDSITRRMIKLYMQPNLQTWRQIVSDIVPVNDFRQQKRERVGGYGTLPVVNQGAPYQPLTSPTDEEAVYSVIKRGGTEDLTLEMIANDDLGAVRQIPRLLGLAAAITLYRFVFDMLATNVTCTYDSLALFHASHANTDNPAVLGQSALSVARVKMRQQSAYNNSVDVLGYTPTLLVVPSALEEMAWQLSTSAVAIPATPAGPTNTPNIHQGMKPPLVVDYWTDSNDWFAVADPAIVPTIEIGFYQGHEAPELFTQADPTVGSMFDADKLTYKIRHTYSGTPLEHRGFYRGNN